jgi:hypothetical protein
MRRTGGLARGAVWGAGLTWTGMMGAGTRGASSPSSLKVPTTCESFPAWSCSEVADYIPFKGVVNRDHYDAFVEEFKKALDPELYATGGIGNGSRLLAMKRPDQFVCLNEPNRKGIADRFNIPLNTGLNNYWERIVQRIRGTDWWQALEPANALEKRIWGSRAALLDAIYYDPKTKRKS